MRSLVAIVFASLAVTAFSCGDDSATNGAADAGSQNARCCPADPAPACCMHYGGWSAFGDCSVTCDGMPAPSDTGWAKAKDTHGCDLWTNASPAKGALCGQPRDASVPDTSQPPPPPPPKDASLPDTSVPDAASPKDAASAG